MLTLVVFIAVLGVLIFVHELGHFMAARAAGIKVEEFAFGFPPRLFAWKRGETTYAINLLPVGGYVRLLGEDGVSKDPRSFGKQSVGRRLSVIVAGVVMNVILAVLVIWIGFMIGMVPLISDPSSLGGKQTPQVLITGVYQDTPAAKADIQPGDIVIGFETPDDLRNFTKSHANQTTQLEVKRAGKTINKEVTLGSGDAPLGVLIYQVTKVKLGPWGAMKAAVIETGKTGWATLKMLGSFFVDFTHKGLSGTESVSGPVGIYKITGQAVELGLTYVLQLLASLSINLALLNILPVPALDGGRALFVVLEGLVRRKVVREEIESAIHAVGFILLLILVGLITYKDIFLNK